MSSLNTSNFVFTTTNTASTDLTTCASATMTGSPITLTGNTIDLTGNPIEDSGTWTTGGLCYNYDPRGWPWMCGKCHKIAFSTNQILNKFCSHDGWMVKLKAGMKL